jgi:hypothetical protein
VHFCLQTYYSFTLLLYLTYHLFLHLLSTNHNCTQPYYFSYYSNLLLKRWWQCGILRWGVLGLRCPGCFPIDYGPFCYSTFVRVNLVFRHIIYVIIILYFMTFDYLWTLYVRVCGINDPGHICDEYFILFTKSGMTEVVPEPCQP